jgi:hypothetical protein
MTEVPKGLMTSKELGMAVADRLVQAEKQPETPGTEPTSKEQPQRRRMLPPARQERGERQKAPALPPIREAQPAPTQENSPDVRTERELAEEQWAEKFLEEMAFSPDAQATDADWERLYRLDDLTYGRVKSNVELKQDLRELRKKGFSENKVLELAARGDEFEKQKTEEWAKVGIRRLPGEAWVKKMQHEKKKWNEKTDEEKKKIYTERIKTGEHHSPRGETDSRLYEEARNELYSDPSWQMAQINKTRVEILGLPPFTEQEWKEYEEKWEKWQRRIRRKQMPLWELIGEMVLGLVKGDGRSLKDKPKDKQ